MVALYAKLVTGLAWFAVMGSATNICGSGSGSVSREYTLNITAGYGAPDGISRPIFLVNGITPGPILTATQGELFIVNVINLLPVQVGMHWHGLHQRGTPEYDGVPGLNQYAIPPGGNLTYCFGTESNYGAYWYHVHMRDIYQDGVRGSILIHPYDTTQRPYDQISNHIKEKEDMMRAEQSSRLLMVNDWFHQTSDEIALRMVATEESMRPLCANSILFNGMGRVECPFPGPGQTTFGCDQMSGMAGMGMSGIASSSTSMPSMGMTSTYMDIIGRRSTRDIDKGINGLASSAPAARSTGIDLPSATSSSVPKPRVTFSADEACQNTTSPLYVLSLPENSTWTMIHFINAGASQQVALSLDEHDFWVVAADGAFVQPHKAQVLKIGIGQRYAVMFRRPEGSQKLFWLRASTKTHQTLQGKAVLAYDGADITSAAEPTSSGWIGVDGSPLNSSIIPMDESKLAPYPAESVPAPTREIRLDVNQSDPTVWVLESGQPFASIDGQQTPLLFEPRNASGIFWLKKGEVVDVLLQIVSGSLDTMGHPIHLHGHYFRVLGSMANSTFPSDMSVNDVAIGKTGRMGLDTSPSAPRRDSAHLPEAGWLAIRIIADNPGVWLLHCHINSHLASGMAVAFIEAHNELAGFSDRVTCLPTISPLDRIPELR